MIKPRVRENVHETGKGSTRSSLDAVDRRSAPRQQFIAEALVVELSSGAKLSARSCDLVGHGCYIDTLNPFPVGTLVRVRLKKDNTTIEANGNVVYRMPGLGMGIAFHNLSPTSREALEQWLSHAPNERSASTTSFAAVEFDNVPVKVEPVGPFAELVQILQKKGILTRAEVAVLLNLSSPGQDSF